MLRIWNVKSNWVEVGLALYKLKHSSTSPIRMYYFNNDSLLEHLILYISISKFSQLATAKCLVSNFNCLALSCFTLTYMYSIAILSHHLMIRNTYTTHWTWRASNVQTSTIIVTPLKPDALNKCVIPHLPLSWTWGLV